MASVDDDKRAVRDAAKELAKEAARTAEHKVRDEEEFWRRRIAGQQDETIRQNNVIYGGLIAIGLVMVQPFLTADSDSLDLPAKICVVAFSIAIPLLAALVMVNQQESFRRRLSKSISVESARVIGQMSAVVGMVAGFWHILPMAGVGILIAVFVGAMVHSAGFVGLEKQDAASSASEPAQAADRGDHGGDQEAAVERQVT